MKKVMKNKNMDSMKLALPEIPITKWIARWVRRRPVQPVKYEQLTFQWDIPEKTDCR